MMHIALHPNLHMCTNLFLHIVKIHNILVRWERANHINLTLQRFEIRSACENLDCQTVTCRLKGGGGGLRSSSEYEIK